MSEEPHSDVARPARASRALAGVFGRALFVGALAGLWVALTDFGATWLWLPVWRDRIGLLFRLIGLTAPLGALLCAALGVPAALGFRALMRRAPARAARSFALSVALVAAPGNAWLAVRLCSGGTMARLAAHGLVVLGFGLALSGLTFGAVRFGLGVNARVAQGRVKAMPVALGLLAAAFVAAKVNENVLPNLYDYLHATLALLGFGLTAFGIATLARAAPRLHGALRRLEHPRAIALGALGLAIALVNDLATLNQNLNVRVAMFDARAGTSRALMAAVNPALTLLESRPRPRLKGRARPEPSADTNGLSTYPDAHVLLVTIDALRADHLGAYGYIRPVSPNFDALAQRALLFRRAYAQAPHSSYSLSSLHTSEYLHEVVELDRPLPKATLATVLRDAGYHTAAFFTDGIFHTEGHKLAPYRDEAFGFALFDHTNRDAEAQTDRVLAEVDRLRAQGEPPSFVWVHYFDVHEPYRASTFGTRDVDRYDSEIKVVDAALARLLREMDARLDRPVVVAISADHGEEFRDHGGVYHGSTLFDEQVRVPLLFRTPDGQAVRVDAPVEVIDIAPTLLGMLGIEAPRSMRGQDLRAIAAGRQTEPRAVFSAVLTKRMALRWPYKLIADLRFNLFELYDLARDPDERRNLARTHPEELAALRDSAYAWLDSLEETEAPSTSEAESARARALRWGRLGDRRAVLPMTELLLDRSAPEADRIEAGQILTKLADESAAPKLIEALSTEPTSVAAEAAIALGRMADPRARDTLSRLVHAEDPYLRARAAVSLGRLRDKRAVPALIDALWVSPTAYEREEAVRWLGRIGDPRAVEPLISVIPEFGLRYLAVVALGQIGDPRAFPTLTDVLEWEDRTNIRDEVVRGLGLLGDERAIAVLLPLLAREPGLKNTAESLIRLGAPARGLVGGRDVDPSLSGRSGLFGCVAGPLRHDWNYLERTYCKAKDGARVELPLPTTHALFAQGGTLIVRAQRADATQAAELALSAGTHELARRSVDSSWSEIRVDLPPEQLAQGTLSLRLHSPSQGAVFAVDHALVVPASFDVLARSGADAEPADDAEKAP